MCIYFIPQLSVLNIFIYRYMISHMSPMSLSCVISYDMLLRRPLGTNFN
jgi:hypothetical protein